jgi:Bacterial protein of unknown function (DUF839)
MRLKRLLALAVAGLVLGGTAAVALAAPGAETGPSSSQSPYVVRSQPGVGTKSILTVGDSVNNKPDGVTPYRMVGIPDGLGAFDNGDGTFTVLMNHEIPADLGVSRAHGANGAFVSKWTIRKDDLGVLHGEDLIQQIATWTSETSTYNPLATGVALARLCSADLAPISAFFNAASGKGYDGRIFVDGEEVGNGGRGFGHLLNGQSYELPAVGKMSFENIVANPASGDRTVSVQLDDSTPGQVYAYAGDKQTTGNPVEQAGLNNGRLYGIKVDGFATEPDAGGIPSGTGFTAFDFGDVRNTSGTTLNTNSNSNGVTNFQRPEDGAWDPNDPSKFYFVTTASVSTNSRLWRLNFEDPANPAAGGTIDMLLDGSEGHRMLDNMTVNDRGQVIMQEDVGNNLRLSKIWVYDIASDSLTEVAEHDPKRFLTGGSDFLTQDEESSGIIPAPFLGEGKYLLDVQAHYSPGDPELVEGGQLLQLQIPPGKGF